MKKDLLDENFDQMFFLFTDSTYNELSSKLNFVTIGDDIDVRNINRDVTDCLEYLSDEDAEYFNSDFVKLLLDEVKNDFFFSHFDTEILGELFFRINPLEIEQVNFMQRYDRRFTNNFEIINEFPRTDKNVSMLDYNISKPFIKVGKYKIDSIIESDLDFSAKVEIAFTPLIENQKWIKFRLFYDLEVDSVYWNDGTKTDFFKGKRVAICGLKLMDITK